MTCGDARDQERSAHRFGKHLDGWRPRSAANALHLASIHISRFGHSNIGAALERSRFFIAHKVAKMPDRGRRRGQRRDQAELSTSRSYREAVGERLCHHANAGSRALRVNVNTKDATTGATARHCYCPLSSRGKLV